jgi:hypothetical protein
LDPPGRRALERLLAGIGLRAIPVLVSILRNERADLAGRSIAARSLGSLAFAQFEMLYETLVRGEIGRAYRFLDNQAVLLALPERGPGARVLAAFYRDAVREQIRFILEVLAIAGRLPDFELIGASIRSGNAKARGNAIETLEQGIPNRMFRLLLPLVDSRPVEDRLVFFHKKYRTAAPLPEALAKEAVGHGTPLEAAAALQFLHERASASFRSLAGAALAEGTPLLRRTAAALLAGQAGEPTIVDGVDCLCRSTFFRHWQVPDLQEIAGKAFWADGFCSGDEALLAVELREDAAGFFPVHGTDRLLGGLQGEAVRVQGPVLLVPAAAVIEEARIRPAIGPALLAAFPEAGTW